MSMYVNIILATVRQSS